MLGNSPSPLSSRPWLRTTISYTSHLFLFSDHWGQKNRIFSKVWINYDLIIHCCESGSGSASLWIRIDMALLDPHLDSHGNGSGSGSRSKELENKSEFQPLVMFYDVLITYLKHIFHIKFTVLWRKSLTRIRIRMDPRTFGSPDADPHWNQCGFRDTL